MELVYMDGKREPYTTSEIVAECAGVQHHTVTRLLRNHKERFEAFRFYGFEIHKLDGKGRSKEGLEEVQKSLTNSNSCPTEIKIDIEKEIEQQLKQEKAGEVGKNIISSFGQSCLI